MENQNVNPLEIDRSQVETARIANIVLMCLAAILPISFIITISLVFKFRSLQGRRKQFAHEWNNTRVDSFREKNIPTLTEFAISQISSSNLDVYYPAERRDNLPGKQKRVSIMLSQISTHKNYSPNHLNDAYLEGGLADEESKHGNKGSIRDSFFNKLLTQHASVPVSISSHNSSIKIIDLKNSDNTIEPVRPHKRNDITKDSKMERKVSSKLGPSHLHRQRSNITNDNSENKKYENQLKPSQAVSSEFSYNPENDASNIEEINSTKQNYNPIVKSTLNTTGVLSKSQNVDFVEKVEMKNVPVRDFDSKSKNTSLTELDYFASPIENNFYRYSGRVSDSLTQKVYTKFNPTTNIYNTNNNIYFKNPLYEENIEYKSDINNKREGLKDLEFYKTHGDSEFNDNGPIETMDEGLSKLHRSPGLLDLNKIVESDSAVNNLFYDDYTNFDDHILSPPPMFCDSPLQQLSRTPSTIPPEPLHKPNILLNPRLPIISTISNNETPIVETHAFDNLPEVQKKMFFEYMLSSHKSKKTAENAFSKNTGLKEEEVLALKYFDDICKELGNDSSNPSEYDDIQDDIHRHRPATHQIISNIESVNQQRNNKILLPANFRKSYEHLLAPDYPYKRRKIITSELISGAPSKLEGIETIDDLTTDVNKIKSQVKGGWIVTHM